MLNADLIERKDAALIGDKLPQEIRIFEIERVHGKIDFRLGPGRAFFRAATTTAVVGFVGIGFAGHRLI